jgi:tripeptidyl-peptidase-1
LGSSLGDLSIQLHFFVKQQNVDKLHDRLMRMSMPSSPEYGLHMSNEEVHELTAPNPQHVAAVVSFLQGYSVEAQMETSSRDIISAKVSVRTAEAMLSAKYVQLKHTRTGVVVNRAPEGYSLPSEVAAGVDFVTPTVHIPGVAGGANHSNLKSPLDRLNTPTNLKTLYNIGDALGKAPKNKQAVTAFLNQHYNEESLKSWWGEYCKGMTCGKGLPKLVGDETTGSQGGVEAMLDIETITGTAGNIESEFWGYKGNSPDNPENEPFMKWLTQLSQTGDVDVPKLFSTSYGEDEKSWSYDAASRLNTEFMKAGARGISLLYASGDEGGNCKDGKYVPEGPGSSPYVTAVGGTQPASGFPSPGSESAIGLSSGGFSNYWPQPSWQKDAVNKYLKQSGLPTSGYNVSGRAYPDISAQATNFCVTPGGCGVAGTSCASPTAAAIFSLLNDVRLQNGQSTLGFLNPLIYSNSAAFNDITTGSSSCGLFGKGWPAKEGWDAVTGVGTPDYAKLAKIVTELPAGQHSLSSRIIV